MARRVALEDDWDDDEEDWDDDDEADTIPCPYCQRQIHEDAERCPYCEHYISDEDAPPPRKPWWIVIGTLLCFYVVYRWVAG